MSFYNKILVVFFVIFILVIIFEMYLYFNSSNKTITKDEDISIKKVESYVPNDEGLAKYIDYFTNMMYFAKIKSKLYKQAYTLFKCGGKLIEFNPNFVDDRNKVNKMKIILAEPSNLEDTFTFYFETKDTQFFNKQNKEITASSIKQNHDIEIEMRWDLKTLNTTIKIYDLSV